MIFLVNYKKYRKIICNFYLNIRRTFKVCIICNYQHYLLFAVHKTTPNPSSRYS